MSSQVIECITGVEEKDIVGRNVIPGKDINGRVTILIKSTQDKKQKVLFENEFFIMKNNIVLEYEEKVLGSFHVLICKKRDELNVSHFERVCDYLFVRGDNSLSSEEMLKLFYSLETIFSVVKAHDKSLEIGLYGELSLINYLYDNNVGELYKAWHTDFFNKHDFEINQKCKIEVKTTVKEERIHTFGHNQICRPNLDVYVVSSKLLLCEKGLSLYELCRKTISILDNKEQMLAIELLMNKLGINYEYQGISCIQEETYKNLKLYKATEVPHLTQEIPNGVSGIVYDIDFSNSLESKFEDIVF